MDNSFISNLRSALGKYSGPKDGGLYYDDFLKAQRDLAQAKFYRQTSGALNTTLQNVGTGIALDSIKTGHPVVGAIGGTIGGLQALGSGIALLEGEKAYVNRRRDANNRMQSALSKSWTEYKNNAIKNSSNGKYSIEKLAKEGKMVDDDGNIVDIDYDYYKTVPYKTLTRVFGENGAAAVRERIKERK